MMKKWAETLTILFCYIHCCIIDNRSSIDAGSVFFPFCARDMSQTMDPHTSEVWREWRAIEMNVNKVRQKSRV